jgi:predicted nucleotidyltransferase
MTHMARQNVMAGNTIHMSIPHEVGLALAELKHALHTIYGDRLQGVYLYGSYARGDFHAGSDVDVLVVLAGPVRPAKEIDRVSEAVADIGLRYDLLLAIYPTSVDWLVERQSPFFKNVRREGVPL